MTSDYDAMGPGPATFRAQRVAANDWRVMRKNRNVRDSRVMSRHTSKREAVAAAYRLQRQADSERPSSASRKYNVVASAHGGGKQVVVSSHSSLEDAKRAMKKADSEYRPRGYSVKVSSP